MGINYALVVVKKKNNKFIELNRKEKNYPGAFGWRYYFYERAFGKKERKEIMRLSGRDFNYDFYDKAMYYEDVEILTDDGYVFYVHDEAYNPQDIRDTVFSTLNILKKYQEKFPIKYWFKWPGSLYKWGDASLTHVPVFQDGFLVHLHGGWDTCDSFKDEAHEDIRNVELVKGKKAIRTYQKDGKKSIFVPGEDVVIKIDPRTSYQVFKEPLEGMIKTCTFAIEKGYYVVGTKR